MNDLTIKLNEEQLARVLDAHTEGRLRSFGSRSETEWNQGRGTGCIFEHAFQMRHDRLRKDGPYSEATINNSYAKFDFIYDRENGATRMSRSQFRELLEDAGFA